MRLVRLKVELNEKNFLDRDRKQLNESEPKAKLEFSESLKIEKARILYDEYFIIMD